VCPVTLLLAYDPKNKTAFPISLVFPDLYNGIIEMILFSSSDGSFNFLKPSVPSIGPGAIPLTLIF